MSSLVMSSSSLLWLYSAFLAECSSPSSTLNCRAARGPNLTGESVSDASLDEVCCLFGTELASADFLASSSFLNAAFSSLILSFLLTLFALAFSAFSEALKLVLFPYECISRSCALVYCSVCRLPNNLVGCEWMSYNHGRI